LQTRLRDALGGGLVFRFGLTQLQLGGVADPGAVAGDPQRLGAAGQSRFKDIEARVQGAKGDVPAARRGRDAERRRIGACLRGEGGPLRGVDLVSEPAEQVQLIGGLEQRLGGGGFARRPEWSDAARACDAAAQVERWEQLGTRQPFLGPRLSDPRGRDRDVGVVGECALDQARQHRIAKGSPPLRLDLRRLDGGCAPSRRRRDPRRLRNGRDLGRAAGENDRTESRS
jgi:hypothetical protein